MKRIEKTKLEIKDLPRQAPPLVELDEAQIEAVVGGAVPVGGGGTCTFNDDYDGPKSSTFCNDVD